jgi:hydroxyacylglutathione hydrolase
MKIAERIHLLASGSLGTGMSHPNDCNVYGIDCGGEFVLIDAGVGRETETIIENLVSDGIQLSQVKHLFLTHGHLDHSGGAAYLRETLKLQVGASRETARAVEQGDERSISLDKAKAAGGYPADFQLRVCPIDQLLCEGQRLGTCELEVIATPGHSHDLLSFCLRTEHVRVLFTGDTLFFGGQVLLSNIYDCNVQEYVSSLRKLERYDFDGLFPGHGLWAVKGGRSHLKTATEALDRLLLPRNFI